MLYGALRLLIISALTLIVTFFIVFMVRWIGGQQIYNPPPHAWFAIPTWTLYQADLEEACLAKTLPSSIAPDWIVALKIHKQEGHWVLKCASKATLEEFFKNIRHRNILIEIEAHETAGLDALVDILTEEDKEKAFGIFSASQSVARYMRKKGPQWLFAADAASMLRFHMFASLWLETAFEFWPDFVLQPPGDKIMQVSERERRELERRKKRIVEMR